MRKGGDGGGGGGFSIRKSSGQRGCQSEYVGLVCLAH